MKIGIWPKDVGTTSVRAATASLPHRPIRRFLVRSAIILAVAALAAWPLAASAKYASIIVDSTTGKVRHAVNADTRNYPASLTKLMTLYMLFEAVENKRITFDSKLTVSRYAANRPPTRLGLQPGDTIPVRIAAQALIVKSANDVATVVAEALGGTEAKFALKMTATARRLGMSRTTFRNASGLPHSGQLSTARDIATLAQALIDEFPQYYPMFAETSFSYGGRTHKTHNRVLVTYDGTDGMKTGYTHASGFNLVTSVKRDNHRLIGVVFGGNTARSRDSHMVSLLDGAFADIRKSGPVLAKKKADPAEDATPATAAVAAVTEEAQGDAEEPFVGKGGWAIQVGAFYERTPASNLAQQVVRKYSVLLDGGQIAITPLASKKGRPLYRARIVGLDQDTAEQACKLMKRAKQPCLKIKLPADQEVAER